MPFQPDVDAMAPTLQLALNYPKRELRCIGTLDSRTRRHVVEAVGELLVDVPPSITIDVARLTVADVDGANTFAHVQRMVREAGVRLRWEGLDSDHLRGIVPLRFRARRPRQSEERALRAARLGHPSMTLRPT